MYGSDLPTEMCVVVSVFEDGLVEVTETVSLELTTDDPAVLLVEPTTAVLTLVSTDGKGTSLLLILSFTKLSISSC